MNRHPSEVIRDFAQLNRLNWYEAIQLAAHSKSWVDLVELRTAIATLSDIAVEIYYGAIDNYCSESFEILTDDITRVDTRAVGDRMPTEDGDVDVTVLSLINILTELCAANPEVGSMRAVSGTRDITTVCIVVMGGQHVLSVY